MVGVILVALMPCVWILFPRRTLSGSRDLGRHPIQLLSQVTDVFTCDEGPCQSRYTEEKRSWHSDDADCGVPVQRKATGSFAGLRVVFWEALRRRMNHHTAAPVTAIGPDQLAVVSE